MKKIGVMMAAAALAISAFVSGPAQAQTPASSTWQQIMDSKTLRVAGLEQEPWFFKDLSGSTLPGGVKVGDTVWRGVAAWTAKEVADAMGVKLEVVETTYANAIAGLQANQFDVVFALDATPKRAMAVDFVAAPLLYYPVSFYSRTEMKGITWAEMNDPKYRIGVTLGGQSQEIAESRLPKAHISGFQTSDDLIAAFQSGRVDGILNPSLLIDPLHAKLKIGSVLVPKPAMGLASGVAVRKEADSRWKDFLAVAMQYAYETGDIQDNYNMFLKFRGVDPSTTVPVIRENW